MEAWVRLLIILILSISSLTLLADDIPEKIRFKFGTAMQKCISGTTSCEREVKGPEEYEIILNKESTEGKYGTLLLSQYLFDYRLETVIVLTHTPDFSYRFEVFVRYQVGNEENQNRFEVFAKDPYVLNTNRYIGTSFINGIYKYFPYYVLTSAEPAPPPPKPVAFRWNIEKLKSNPLEIKLGKNLREVLKKFIMDNKEYNPIEQMGEIWNQGHPEIKFFNLPFGESTIDTDKDYDDLELYLDDELGIYASYKWYKDLSKDSLGVTQFFGRRVNAGTDKEYFEIAHADTIFNFRDHKFGFQGETDLYDFYTAVLHEMGHFLGLPHSLNPEDKGAVMSPHLDKGEIRRNLLESDLKSLFFAYPNAEAGATVEIPYAKGKLERFIIEFMPDGKEHMRNLGTVE